MLIWRAGTIRRHGGIDMSKQSRRRALIPLPLLVLACATSHATTADLYTAQDAYNKGDYQQAFEAYRNLAELGQPTAQFDLAVMYARGLGGEQNELKAYAWASIAADNGDSNGRALAAKLRPDLAPDFEKSVEALRAQFGPKALDERLLPKIQSSEAAEALERESCRSVHPSTPEFPPAAWEKGVQGVVYAEYTVVPDGNARNMRIVYAQPQGVFDAAVRDALLHSRFPVPGNDSKPIHCTMYYDFVKAAAFASAHPTLSGFVQRTHVEALTGRPSSQLLYGLLLSGLPELRRPRSEALYWFLKAAQAGSSIAQYQVGYSLLTGWGCERDENKGLEWMHHAADQDQPNAQVALAEHLLRGTPDDEKVKQAKTWLERAAATGSRDGKVHLAALLAASPDASVRDPSRARALSEEAFANLEDDPTGFEIRAAAEANAGNFGPAADTQQKAIERASHLGWNLAPLKERLARYQSQQSWDGDLLASQ